MRTTRFWNNFNQARSKSKGRGKKIKKIIENMLTKGHKHGRQNRLWSPMSEGGESLNVY